MKKSDVEISYHQGHHGCPMVNVKHHLWVPDLIRKYKDNGTHEFSDDAGFWAWLEEQWDSSNYDAWDSADEWARELCWEDARECAHDIWPFRELGVWGAGRSGGWLVVEGLRPVEDWDAIELGRWARFVRRIEAIRDEEYPYQFVWQLGANVYEHVRQERAGAYPAPHYEGSNA